MKVSLSKSDLRELLQLVESVYPACLIISDETYSIKYINDVGIKLFEIDELDFEIKDLFINIEDWEDLLYKLNNKKYPNNFTYLLKSSSYQNIFVSITILVKDGYLYWLIRDISLGQKQKEEIDHQRALLEKSKIEMDRIIYSASHDLRSPISSILGLLNLLELPHSKTENSEYISLIRSSILKLDNIVQNLGRISKNSNEVVKDEKIDFENLLDQINLEFSNHPNYDEIKYQHSIIDQYVFYNDINRVKLVLYNLLKNCYDFYDKNKSYNFIDLEVFCLCDKAIIKLFDNGIGISKNTVSKVFDLFYRGSDRSKGSGLGLFETKEIIIKLNGKITLNSEYTIGTSIEVEIPNSKKGKLINKKNSLVS
ncbi:sensor histidine kinase [Marivirga arenosa]|uniref:histidine kinase n=1 Tax=Marivirga arenosa TaxID=3059076 RepID=A0AA49JAE1_9BACT|nr:HAMP domain-containing sensor histidine kinase [Marivirga sp. BKB1-2]WKK81615.1 HAMP domain-containing sensor histidine kinase [Marivirga sp. BKB1-2]